MSSGAPLRLDRPFLGGMVDVVTPDQLKDNQSPELRDLTLHQGVALERGGWGVIGQAAVFGATNYLTGVAVLLPDQTVADYVVTAAGKVGIATSGGRNGDATDTTMLVSATTYYPGPLWNGEQLLLPQDGESPILRYAGCLTSFTPGLGTGTIGFTTGQNTVFGVGTSFSANWIGAFIRTSAQTFPTGWYRVVSVESTTRMTLDAPAAFSGTTPFYLARFAPIGLQVVVTDLGIINGTTGGGSLTITGNGTGWDSTPKTGYGRPGFYAGGDRSLRDSLVSKPLNANRTYTSIDAVASDNSLTVSTSTAGAFTGITYQIARPMPGTVSCAHENRLYICGVSWRRRTLFISPPGYNCSTGVNGELSATIDPAGAVLMADQDIGGPTTPGTLNALLSLPSGMLLILSDADAHVGWGEYPSFSAEEVADVGCFGQRAAIAEDEGAWYAGREGVFEVQGNKPVNIIHDQLGNTWDALMEDTNPTAILGIVHNHLYVFVKTDSQTKWLVWDRRARVWCGVWSTNMPTAPTWLDSARTPGVTDRLLMSHADDQLADINTTIFHGDAPLVTTNPGRFKAVTPSNIAGSTGRLKRVRGAKVGYVLKAASGTPTLDVSTALTPDATPTLEDQGSLPAGTAYELVHKRVKPTDGNLGRESREFSVTIERSATPTVVSRCAVHDLELVVAERRVRA